MQGVCKVETGVYSAEAGIEVNVDGFCTISSYGSSSQKTICLRKKAFIKECVDTYKSIVNFLVFANLRHSFDDLGEFGKFMIKYQDKSLVN